MKLLNKRLIWALCALCVLATACHRVSNDIYPSLAYTPPRGEFERLAASFAPLNESEKQQTWGQEYQIGVAFGKEYDFYRAVTAFKRALILAPQDSVRRLQIQYDIVLTYYLAGKYAEAVNEYANSSLNNVGKEFGAYNDLLVILYDAYSRLKRPEEADAIMQKIKQTCPERAVDLQLGEALRSGDLKQAEQLAQAAHSTNTLYALKRYAKEQKSVRRAQALNALLPGAGYFYLGQKGAGFTALALNAAFIAAAAHFFCRGDVAAGVIFTGFECGWYFGGIYGAGLSARQYNERLFEKYAQRLLVQEKLYPVLMLQKSF